VHIAGARPEYGILGLCLSGVPEESPWSDGQAAKPYEAKNKLKLSDQYCDPNVTTWPFGAFRYFAHYIAAFSLTVLQVGYTY